MNLSALVAVGALLLMAIAVGVIASGLRRGTVEATRLCMAGVALAAASGILFGIAVTAALPCPDPPARECRP